MKAFLRALTAFAPTRRFAAVILLCAPVWLASGSTTGKVVAVVVVGLLILAVLSDMVRLPTKAQISLTRTLPETLSLREDGEGTYTITSTWQAPLAIRLEHATCKHISSRIPQHWTRILPHRSQTIPFTLQGLERGTHDVRETAVVVRGYLGLIRKTIIYDLKDTIKFIPPTRGIRGFRLLAIQQRMQMYGNRAIRYRGSGTSFANLRDYAVGDDPRHIDWKATARRNHLITREYTIEQGQTVFIVIDAGRMMTQIAGDRPRLEYALSSALILADVALTIGDRVGLLIFNEKVRHYVEPDKGQDTLAKIRNALVNATATMTEPDYAAAFRTLAERNRKRSLVVFFTDVIDSHSSRLVVANTARTRLRHLPLVVALQNEQLTQSTVPAPKADDLSAFRNVAAEELITARNDVLQRMRQAGVNVLDTPPASMTTALINRYLEIKDRALL